MDYLASQPRPAGALPPRCRAQLVARSTRAARTARALHDGGAATPTLVHAGGAPERHRVGPEHVQLYTGQVSGREQRWRRRLGRRFVVTWDRRRTSPTTIMTEAGAGGALPPASQARTSARRRRRPVGGALPSRLAVIDIPADDHRAHQRPRDVTSAARSRSPPATRRRSRASPASSRSAARRASVSAPTRGAEQGHRAWIGTSCTRPPAARRHGRRDIGEDLIPVAAGASVGGPVGVVGVNAAVSVINVTTRRRSTARSSTPTARCASRRPRRCRST